MLMIGINEMQPMSAEYYFSYHPQIKTELH